eukprot:scaffold337_cov172-Amphora_coffeaeformis.AAC.19
MFYSRAGKIDPPFAHQATAQDVYDLLQWVHYTRSIEDVGTAKAATKGAVLVEAMFRVLQRGFYQQRMAHTHQRINHDDYDTRITILAGHDGDLDAMATAMGVSWQPDDDVYHSHMGQYLPTPPMSGIHAVRNVETGNIKIEFIFPVYDLTGALNATIFPKSVSVDFSSLSTIDPSSITLEELRAHTIEQLQRYTGATDCFQAASLFHAHDEFAESSGSSSVRVSTTAPLVAIGTVCGFLVAVLVCRGLIQQRMSNQAQNYEPTGVQDPNGLEMV